MGFSLQGHKNKGDEKYKKIYKEKVNKQDLLNQDKNTINTIKDKNKQLQNKQVYIIPTHPSKYFLACIKLNQQIISIDSSFATNLTKQMIAHTIKQDSLDETKGISICRVDNKIDESQTSSETEAQLNVLRKRTFQIKHKKSENRIVKIQPYDCFNIF